MKMYSLLVVVCFIFCNFTHRVKAQDNDLYQSSMQKAVNKLDAAMNIDELSDTRNLFERIAMKFNNKWQPVYYIAYCDMQMVFFDIKSEVNNTRLEDAKKQLEKLELFADVDESELNTLWGYYYNARIAINPESAQTLFGQVIASLEKAIELNPDNPRAIILRAFFNQYLPSFVKLKIDMEAEVNKAKELFGKEEKSIVNPYWGAYFINQIKVN